MIFSAYVLSLGFVESGLGRRIAYKMLSLFGGSSLGIAFSLGVADLILAPAMPSVTARSGGIVLPVAKSINMVLDSQPGPKQVKIIIYSDDDSHSFGHPKSQTFGQCFRCR